MPELPEVETIRLQLNKFLVGHKIEEIEVKVAKMFSGEKNKAIGTRISGTRRFGKVLVIDLDNGYSILFHLKLTGQLIYQGPNLPTTNDQRLMSPKILGGVPGKHTHIIFHLDKGAKLYFNDVRKFGWVKVVESKELTVGSKLLGNLGPEPMKDLTLEKFKQILSKSSRPVKIILMDQAKISGVGNIYANDALFLAKIRPERKASSLIAVEAEVLLRNIEKVLKKGIKTSGASDQYYVTPDGSEGQYQEHFLVYGQEGNLCKNCKKQRIRKTFLAGRGTYFCPGCQK